MARMRSPASSISPFRDVATACSDLSSVLCHASRLGDLTSVARVRPSGGSPTSAFISVGGPHDFVAQCTNPSEFGSHVRRTVPVFLASRVTLHADHPLTEDRMTTAL